MTSHAGRLYSLALALVVFFLAWAVVAARPWASAAVADPHLAALAAREAKLQREAKLVDRVVARRWADYRAALRVRNAEIARAKTRIAAAKARAAQTASLAAASVPASATATAPAPAAPAPRVRVVTLPPLTITKSS